MKALNSPIHYSLLVRYLFYLTAAILTFFAAATFTRIGSNPDMAVLYSVYAVLMLGDAAAMLVCGWFISKQKKQMVWIAVIVLSINIILTIFDQFGIVDLMFLLLNVITLVLLLISRKELLPR